MPFDYSRGSQDTLISLSGDSLATVTGVQFVSGITGTQCTLISSGNNLITFYPPAIPPSGIRSGQFAVRNLFGVSTTSQYFTWINTPYISGIAPLSGFTGVNFKISGSGIRDATGLYLISPIGIYTGVLNDPIFEANTWIRTGIIPWMSGGLNSYVNVKVMSEGGSSTASSLFYVREDGISLSGLVGFPSPIQTYNFLRGNSTADALEWRTPTQVLENDLTGVSKKGDYLTGDFYLTGGALYLTGLVVQNSGLATGQTIFRSTIFSGNYLTMDAIVGGITWRGFSYKFS